jgi:hypothetical protein
MYVHIMRYVFISVFLEFLDTLYVFEYESSRHLQFSFTDFSLVYPRVYRSASAQVFTRSQPMRESNASTNFDGASFQGSKLFHKASEKCF